jgi:hypothetical protein
MTATSFSGGRPGFRRTHYLAFTVLRSIAIERKVLGEHIDVQVEAYDETNTVIDVKGIAARIVASGNTGIVCLVGVQSNQYPRARPRSKIPRSWRTRSRIHRRYARDD